MASLRKSINDFCKYCIYDPKWVGTWLQQVRDCPAKDCPLYPVRPGRKKTRNENEETNS
jgi:hypothetical protein